MKAGICAFRPLRYGRVLLETKSKEEIELFHKTLMTDVNNC
jgi:hypothetical protein